MQISKHSVVSLKYTLTLNNETGELIEQSPDDNPLKFIYGIGMMIPGFESNLENKIKGDLFSFTLEPSEAYGNREEDAIVNIPVEQFKDDNGEIDRTKLVLGQSIHMSDPEGNTYQGIISNAGLEIITVDFNHPMSGKTLHFKGEILEVREATDSELDHGHVH